MQHDQRQLFEIARDYPWYHFTAEEISVLCNVGEHKVRLARNAKDTRFDSIFAVLSGLPLG